MNKLNLKSINNTSPYFVSCNKEGDTYTFKQMQELNVLLVSCPMI